MPGSTYRLQINAGFPLDEAARLVPYLRRLGIGAAYLSPVFAATPGSAHGYDVCDPGRVNPEVGGEEAFSRLSEALKAAGLGCLLDIVPNHMSADPNHNLWWRDVLKRGPASPFAGFFDIDWNPRKTGLRGKVLLPVLGTTYGEALESGALRLERSGESGEVVVRYGEQDFPLSEESLRRLENLLPGDGGRDDHLRALNGTPGEPASFDALHALLEEQFYRLSSWKAALHEANYRRFFDVSTLLGVRVEAKEVFEATHALLRRLVRAGHVTGARVDHVDGLRDPAAYLGRLRGLFEVEWKAGRKEERPEQPHEDLKDARSGAAPRLSDAPWLVVEKILQEDEALPADWPVDGTTGYEFMSDLNGLFLHPQGLETLRAAARRFQGAVADREQEINGKRLVLSRLMRSELNQLADRLDRLSEADRRARDFTRDDLRAALREIIAVLPVYRTYGRERSGGGDGFLSPADERLLVDTVAEAARRTPSVDAAVFAWIREMFLSPGRDDLLSSIPREARLGFVLRFQQTTGSAAAKGVEDTAFYRNPALLSLHEVGASPHADGTPAARFHARMADRRAARPRGMLATSTHDAKRGEDARARLDALSHPPHAEAWRRFLDTRQKVRTRFNPVDIAPDLEHYLYQSLLGSWPLDARGHPARVDEEFFARVEGAWIKAARESKRDTDWIRPDEEHEAGLRDFLEHLLRGRGFAPFARAFFPILRACARDGMRFSLAQVACKCAAPGIPDVYQGAEFWDLSFVDPDNRRPVDFAARTAALESIAAFVDPDGDSESGPDQKDRARLAARLLKSWPDGRVKQYVLARCLRWRRRHARLFLEGAYEPLMTMRDASDPSDARDAGDAGDVPDVLAFRRVLEDEELVVVIPLGARDARRAGGILLPDAEARSYRDLFTGRRITASVEHGRAILDRSALADFPAAWLWRLSSEAAGIPAGGKTGRRRLPPPSPK